MQDLLENYAAAHRYGISTTADFKAAAQAATSVNPSSFRTTHRIDGQGRKDAADQHGEPVLTRRG